MRRVLEPLIKYLENSQAAKPYRCTATWIGLPVSVSLIVATALGVYFKFTDVSFANTYIWVALILEIVSILLYCIWHGEPFEEYDREYPETVLCANTLLYFMASSLNGSIVIMAAIVMVGSLLTYIFKIVGWIWFRIVRLIVNEDADKEMTRIVIDENPAKE
jgi:amino acid transporter